MKRLIRILLVASLLLPLGGCWDISAPVEPILVNLIAVSWQKGIYRVAVESVVPRLFTSGGASMGGGGQAGPAPVWLLKGQGATVLAALGQAGLDLSDELLLSHMRFLILDRSVLQPVAWRGMEDSLLRYPPLRQNFLVFLAQGPADKVAGATNPVGAYPGEALLRAAELSASNGGIIIRTFYQVEEDLFNVPFEPSFVPMVAAQPAPPPDKGYHFSFPGEAILYHDNLAGILRNDQVATWALLTNAASENVTATPSLHVINNSERLGATVQGAKTRIEWQKGHINVQEKLVVTISHYDTLGKGPQSSSTIPPNAILAATLAQEVVREDLKLIHWSQKHRLDILGVGGELARDKPGWIKAESATWPQQYAQASVSLKVQVKVRDEGNLVLPGAENPGG